MIKLKNKNLIIIGVVALLIGGGAGFFAGTKYQQSKTVSQRSTANGNPGGRMMGRFGNANGMAVRGQIISADKGSITVKMQDGSTKIVILGSSTMVGKTSTGSVSDLTNGSTVIVFGATNSDGSITAQNIQVGNGVTFGPRESGSPMPTPTPAGY